jgi:hypothetical protein
MDMKEQYIDTYIYVKAAKKHHNQDNVVDIIKGITGVVNARQHTKLANLVEISYNSQGVDTSHIVHAANQQGCNVVSVGM